MNYLPKILAKLLALLTTVAPSAQSRGGTLQLNCSGQLGGKVAIAGCFASEGNTRYVNLKNGQMKGPGGSSILDFTDKKECILSIEMEAPLIPGHYRCGIILQIGENNTDFVLITSFRASSPQEEGSSTQFRTQNEAAGKRGDIATKQKMGPQNKRPTMGGLAGLPAAVVAFTSLGWCASILVIVLVYLGLRQKTSTRGETPMTSSTAPLRSILTRPPDRTNCLERVFQDQDPPEDIPPPMKIIPVDSITRYLSKYSSPHQKSFGYTRKVEQFV